MTEAQSDRVPNGAGRRLTGVFLHVLPAVAYAAALLAMGTAPAKATPDAGIDDKTAHLVCFAVQQLLATRAARFLYPGRSVLGNLGAAAAVSIGIGVLLEVLQSFTADRTPEFADLVADVTGIALAALVYWAWFRLAPRGSPASS